MKVSERKGMRSSGRSRPKAKPRTRQVSHARAKRERPRLVVGIGASAGGLNAFKGFLDNLPPDTGMAFVLVQHLDPHHRSMLVELLGSHTAMPIAEATHGAFVSANHIFVIPPDATLCIKGGALEVETPAPPGNAADLSIRSLHLWQKTRERMPSASSSPAAAATARSA